MNWIIVKKVSLATDLSAVVGYLREQGIAHQVYEEAGQQVLAVTNPHIVTALLNMLDGVEQGAIQFETRADTKVLATSTPSFVTQLRAAPVTVWLILLSLVGAGLVEFDRDRLFVSWFTFQDFTGSGFIPLATSLYNGEIWRLLTPAFLHFSFLHVLFNSMWMWELGRRLEFLLGKFLYLIFFLTTAIAANIAQYFWSGSSVFGGMSGVVYALVGFIMVSHRLVPHPLTAVAPGILTFMLAWLAFCTTGFLDRFIGGGVANAAHIGGLAAGIVFALIVVTVIKIKRRARE